MTVENKVLLFLKGTPPEEIVRGTKYWIDTGEAPPGAFLEDFDVWTARGRVEDCDCQLIQCVCTEARRHQKGCQRRFAMTCAIPISCKLHGLNVCNECDPCSCGELNETNGT